MKIYLVGGSVRDFLLSRKSDEKDWVVIDSSIEEMLSLGYIQVGKNFPVFLHPKTKEEYSLARIDKKTSIGHKGFTFDTSKHITIEEDLQRRDLTINAMAMDENGNIIDPTNGKKDLENRILRHINNAYKEDPLRLFRTARFYTQLSDKSFYICDQTYQEMRNIVNTNTYIPSLDKYISEVESLPKERIWKESQKALSTQNSYLYFEALYKCSALSKMLNKYSSVFNSDFKPILLKSESIKNSSNRSLNISAMILDLAQWSLGNMLFNTDEHVAKKCFIYIENIFGIPKVYIEKFNFIYEWIKNLDKINTFSPKDLIDFLVSISLWRNFETWDIAKTIILNYIEEYSLELDFPYKKLDNVIGLLIHFKFDKNEIQQIESKEAILCYIKQKRINTIAKYW